MLQAERSYPYADVGGHGCHPAAHGSFPQGVKIMPVVAGTLNGVGTCSIGTQRKNPIAVAILISP